MESACCNTGSRKTAMALTTYVLLITPSVQSGHCAMHKLLLMSYSSHHLCSQGTAPCIRYYLCLTYHTTCAVRALRHACKGPSHGRGLRIFMREVTKLKMRLGSALTGSHSWWASLWQVMRSTLSLHSFNCGPSSRWILSNHSFFFFFCPTKEIVFVMTEFYKWNGMPEKCWYAYDLCVFVSVPDCSAILLCARKTDLQSILAFCLMTWLVQSGPVSVPHPQLLSIVSPTVTYH